MSLRGALLVLFRRIVRIYFRDIEVAGDLPRPETGGRLFAANHVNGLVDPILVLTQAPCRISPIAKSTLWQIPGLRWLLDAAEAVPIVRRRDVPGKSESDNDAVFTRVASHLVSGGNILIFPEGTSHNEPHLLALRSGAGRMLARAHVEPGAAGLGFQAVALEFDERDIFRSRALVLFGPVRLVSEIARGDDLAEAITAVIRADLSELLVEGATWDERLVLVRVAEMFARDAADGSLGNLNRVGRRIEEAKRILAHCAPDDLRATEERVRAYAGHLEREETTDEQVVAVARGRSAPFDGARTARAAAMLLALPLAVVALVLYGLPYRLPRFVARRLSSDPDVASTYKLGVGLVVYPVWAALLVAIVLLRLPSLEHRVLASLVIGSAPFAALPWLDRWDRLAARARQLAPSTAQRDRLHELATERAALMRDLDALRLRAGV